MSEEWETEEEERVDDAQVMLQHDVATLLTTRKLDTIGKQRVKEGYETKAYLVLVGSAKEDWGIIEDTLNNLLWEPGKGEVVGTWSRTNYDGFIHISLATAISALQDRSIQTFVHYAEERRQREQSTQKPTKRVKKTSEPAEEEPAPGLSVEEEMRFNDLRSRLGRTK